MERNDVLATVTSIFRQVLKCPNLTITDEMTSADINGWDSLSHMVLINAIQMRFGIRFRLSELNRIRSVGDFVDAIMANTH